ncbi:MAG: S-layer homology domain-containing protein, partial [Oscillibacter sp.]|nr:S-layer homology domain-containing protein [Oscillibacter sp.]
MKKFLSLVLALVMAMSLVTLASAKDFTDDGSITYKEAVDVISELDVVDGYSDGSFRPKGTLTRGAAAKIISNLILGPTDADALPTNVSPFKDVPAGSTFAGYIAFCSSEGIISGYSDGTFKPAGTLSGYAFMKMLLGALGYNQYTENYVGANWKVNVAKRAMNVGLDDDLESAFNGSRALTREEACLYALNTLKADM